MKSPGDGTRRRLLRLWWLGVVVALALASVVGGKGTLGGPFDLALFSRALLSAPSPGWPEDVVLVSIPDGDPDWDATQLAGLVAKLDGLGARTIVFENLPIAESDPGVPLLLDHADSLVLGAGIDPTGRALSEPEWSRVLHDVRVEWPVTVVPEAFRFPPAALVLGSAHVGHDTPILDHGSYNVAKPIVKIEGREGILPSLALLAYSRQRELDLESALRRASIRGDEIFLDLRGGDAPPDISSLAVLDGSKEAPLRPLLDGRMVVVRHSRRFDAAVFGAGIVAPGSMRFLYELRAYETGRPIVASRAWALGLLTLSSVALVRRFRGVTPAVVVSVAVAAAVSWTVGSLAVMSVWGIWLGVTAPVLFIFAAAAWFAFLSSLSVQQRLERAEARADASTAPTGRIALVFTDVQGSSTLWEKAPTVMRVALDLHNGLLRRLLDERGGYEVKTEGDAFMVAFGDPVSAVRWCVDVQRALVSLDWPPELLALLDAAEVRDEYGTAIFRGLRVRMGVHLDEPEAVPDPRTGRMDYFGPPVNRAARIAGSAQGGQILVGGDAWRAVEPRIVELGLVRSRRLGARVLRGLAEPEELVEVLPEVFRARVFPELRTMEK